MLKHIFIRYFDAPRKLNKEQFKLIKELAKTRKNVFQQSLWALSELYFWFKQWINSFFESPEWTLLQEERRTQKFRENKQKIIGLKNKCLEAGIPEEMIKPLILDYDDLLKYERSSFNLVNYQLSFSNISIAFS